MKDLDCWIRRRIFLYADLHSCSETGYPVFSSIEIKNCLNCQPKEGCPKQITYSFGLRTATNILYISVQYDISVCGILGSGFTV